MPYKRNAFQFWIFTPCLKVGTTKKKTHTTKKKYTNTLEWIKRYLHAQSDRIEFHSMQCINFRSHIPSYSYVCSNHNIDRKNDLYVNTPVINHIMQWLSFAFLSPLPIVWIPLSALLNFRRFQVCASNLYTWIESPFSILSHASAHLQLTFGIYFNINYYLYIDSNVMFVEKKYTHTYKKRKREREQKKSAYYIN